MSLDRRAQLLDAVVSDTCGIREAIQKLRWRPSIVISLLEMMKEERLIKFEYARAHKRGRPKKNIVITSLGFDFLETFRRLKMKPLRARKQDLEHAMKDASYTERLVANGHSPFKLFIELNTFAHNTKISSETPEAV